MKRSCLWAVESWSVSYLKRPRRGLRFFHADFLGPERATRARSGNSAVQKLPPVGLQKKRGGVKAVHGGRLGASSWFRYLEGMGLPVTFGCVICLDPTEEGFSMCKSLSHWVFPRIESQFRPNSADPPIFASRKMFRHAGPLLLSTTFLTHLEYCKVFGSRK